MKFIKQKKLKNKVFCEIFGKHAVYAALKNTNRKHQKLFFTKNHRGILDHQITKLIPEIKELQNVEMNKIFGTEKNHQGIVLKTSKIEQPSLQNVISNSQNKQSDVIIVLDQVTDPINIGSIMRSCALFNCDSIIVSKDNAPDITGNMAKAASGALEVTNYISVVNLSRAINQLKKNDFWIYGFDSNSSKTNFEFNLPKKCVFVFGSEGKGLRNLTKKECDELIELKIKSQKKFRIDSLNVSNACSIALYEYYKKNY
ncbi:23S rRNA (guanosine(2251)-2'-O)-methyltransferase RlmB [Alphaproteobacteria bacterium]|nr:23S rRNA (guanosine(2251)-2'-O)-methyltransferase RlmB [Alphaproteobacteria bacterium]